MRELTSGTSLASALKDANAVLLLCVVDKKDRTKLLTLAKEIEKAHPRVESATTPYVELVIWDWILLTQEKRAALSEQLSLASNGMPVALAIHQGKVLDKVEGMSDIAESLSGFYGKFSQYVGQPSVAQVKSSSASSGNKEGSDKEGGGGGGGHTLNVNITRIIMMGNDLMQKGQSMYAEKFYLKALTALKVLVEGEQLEGEEIDGSMVECLSLLIISQCVQGKVATTDCRTHFKELSSHRYKTFWSAPKTNGARATALYTMLVAAPFTYEGAKSSVKGLKKILEGQHKIKEEKEENLKKKKEEDETAVADVHGLTEEQLAVAQSEPWTHLRARLAVTYFLGGMLGESFTEGLKLFKFSAAKSSTTTDYDEHNAGEVGESKASKIAMEIEEGKQLGIRTLDALVSFLGEDDALVKASLWLEHRPKD